MFIPFAIVGLTIAWALFDVFRYKQEHNIKHMGPSQVADALEAYPTRFDPFIKVVGYIVIGTTVLGFMAFGVFMMVLIFTSGN